MRLRKPAANPKWLFLTLFRVNQSSMIPRFSAIIDGVGAIVSTQLGKDVPDLALHGVFGDRELRRNLFVGIAIGDQAQDAHFRR